MGTICLMTNKTKQNPFTHSHAYRMYSTRKLKEFEQLHRDCKMFGTKKRTNETVCPLNSCYFFLSFFRFCQFPNGFLYPQLSLCLCFCIFHFSFSGLRKQLQTQPRILCVFCRSLSKMISFFKLPFG